MTQYFILKLMNVVWHGDNYVKIVHGRRGGGGMVLLIQYSHFFVYVGQ
jgi:hypothetical protein